MAAEAALNLTGGETIVGRRARGEQLAQERLDLCGPGRSMIAARSPGNPGALAAGRTGTQIIGIELVEACAPEAQLRRRSGGRQRLSAKGCENLTDERRSEPVNELLILLFIARKGTANDG
jgi:hypothetical protein